MAKRVEPLRAAGGIGRPLVAAKSRRSAVVYSPTGSGAYFTSPREHMRFIGSGCKTLDLALGGGWACDRVNNLVGDTSAGKTLLAIEACANFARQFPKGKIRYREREEAFDLPYGEALGLPTDRIDFGGDKPFDTVEGLFRDLEKVIAKAKPGSPEFYIVDSLDALTDEAEQKREINKRTYGTDKAGVLSETFRRINGQVSRAGITLLIISQIRDNIGVMFGPKKKRAGGNALDFYSSQVVWLHRGQQVKRTISGVTRATGIDVVARVRKNKVSIPYREAAFTIRFGYGVDDQAACVNFLKTLQTPSTVMLGRNFTGKGLEKIDAKIAKYYEWSDKLDSAAYQEELARLHTLTENEWFALERKFLDIPRRKYG